MIYANRQACDIKRSLDRFVYIIV